MRTTRDPVTNLAGSAGSAMTMVIIVEAEISILRLMHLLAQQLHGESDGRMDKGVKGVEKVHTQ